MSLPSSGSGEKCKHCSNPGHITSLCPRKAAEKRGESEGLLAEFVRTGAACNLCAAVGIKDGSHRSRHHTLAAQDQYTTGGGNSNADKDNGKNKGKGGGKGGSQGKGGSSSSAGERQARTLFAQGRCTYGDKCKFAHVKDSSNQQEATQTLIAKEKKAAKKKEKKEKAKGGGSNAEEKVYPLFEVASGSSGGEGAVVYDSAHQVAEPTARQWRFWPGSMTKLPAEQRVTASAPQSGFNAQTKTSCAGVELVTLL